MTEGELQILKQYFTRVRERCNTPEKASDYLQKTGMLDDQGRLAPEYVSECYDGEGDLVGYPEDLKTADLVWVVGDYVDTIKRRPRKIVEKENHWSESRGFGKRSNHVFDDEYTAVQFLWNRARNELAKAKVSVKKASARVEKHAKRIEEF